MTKRTSSNYYTTYDVKSEADMRALATLRETVSQTNRLSGPNGPKLRVVIRGRKPFLKKIVTNIYTGKVSLLSYSYGGAIVGGLANAQKYDVYVYNR